jgi:hypothetical protein
MKFKNIRTIFFCLCLISPLFLFAQSTDTTSITIKSTNDFKVTGDGSNTNWNKTDWINLVKRDNPNISYQTKIKLLYSDSGIYCLYNCEDKKLTSTLKEDFSNLWTEDVVEAFFWTDEKAPLYFEYELSPMDYELAILVPNFHGDFLGWRPWIYEGNRRTKHATHIYRNGDAISSWTAEVFIPYRLLKPLQNVPPKTGTKWRANFYRIDHDNGSTEWSWQLTRTNFHDYERFGTIVFE